MARDPGRWEEAKKVALLILAGLALLAVGRSGQAGREKVRVLLN